jgi:hypothetical protein
MSAGLCPILGLKSQQAKISMRWGYPYQISGIFKICFLRKRNSAFKRVHFRNKPLPLVDTGLFLNLPRI